MPETRGSLTVPIIRPGRPVAGRVGLAKGAAVAVMLLMAAPNPTHAQGSESEDQVRVVLATYVSAWRDGDVERLATIFDAAEGRVMWLSGEGQEQSLASMTFQQILDRGSRPNPEYGLEWDVLSVDVVDDQLAVAKLYISRAGGSYVDYLTLQKIGGVWRIVNKTFVVR